MSKASIDQQIRDRIDSFVAELTALVREAALDSVKEALADEGRTRRGPGRPRRLAGLGIDGRRGSKRTPQMLEDLKSNLLEVIQLNPGQRMEELGRLMNLPTKELTLPARKLLGEKRIKTKGQKRATTYWAR